MKKNLTEWQWNEIQQVGTDYNDLAEVETYDKRMGNFRDVDSENREILEMLNLAQGASVLEIGCGTGRFARSAAKAGLTVTAIDVSEIMLEYLSHKADEDNCEIKTSQGGFLTMDFPAASFDAVVSGLALHHLPDVWKMVALRNIAKILKPEGQFILRDVVFKLRNDEEPDSCFERFLDSVSEAVRAGAVGHIAREFSTYDWIMEGLLLHSGFEIISVNNCAESLFVYHCHKK
jgi:ubiquinone/menaquinone biosynthesis C-methylase UbiE